MYKKSTVALQSDLLNEKLESVLREYEKKEAVTAILNSLKMHTDTTSATATNGVTAGASQLSNHEESSTVVPEASTKFNLTEALARANREIKLRQQISQEKQYLSERVSELESKFVHDSVSILRSITAMVMYWINRSLKTY